ncbi:phospholipase D family protein [Seleniivibrio woodruffii]|uniref:phospholipase D family protein n=1 Tax=Seleniivibrio woodruffii TaxID=1078050 RepID=UPI00240A83B8|nr:phospholipase D family protein [Seleniivibrio woodruffii]
MAVIEPIIQGLASENHLSVISGLLSNKAYKNYFICSAFLSSFGVAKLESIISARTECSFKFFIGIRNNITSAQALLGLYNTDSKVFTIDTGSNILFHPKLYCGYNKSNAEIIMGSANLTIGGLNNNIEMSTRLILDLSNPEDRTFFERIKAIFNNIHTDYTENVSLLTSKKDIIFLLRSGLLIDERIVIKNTQPSKTKSSKVTTTPEIKLKNKKIFGVPLKRKPKLSDIKKITISPDTKYLVWQNPNLVERDLQIPKGANTNATGSMLFKKAEMKIDQRHYFRNEVFNNLAWSQDPKKTHIERATADFEIVIKGVSYGNFTLQLSHKTDTTSTSYQQNQPMTQIHWGEVKPLIAKEALKHSILNLFANEERNLFTIEIL